MQFSHYEQYLQLFLTTVKTALIYMQMHVWVCCTFIVVVLGLIGIVAMTAPKKNTINQTPAVSPKITTPIATNKDISAIAGDDVFATQLDLAKAYIEMDQHELAKKILKETLKSGSADQQERAQELLGALS